MSPETHRRVRSVFDQALELPEAERPTFVDAECADDPEVRERVRRLLDSHRASDGFLENGSGPQRLGRYVILRPLGSGAMAVVYEAADPVIGRNVALKTIRMESLRDADSDHLKQRLFQEARSAGTLSHPGIVTIFDVGQEGDTAFIAMELMEGRSLAELAATDHKPSLAELLDILRQVAAALDYAHQKGIVHRDIKPANIMLDQHRTAKVADFGVAKIATMQHRLSTGLILGTPAYMSPEQIESQPLDGRSDQFSLAVTAFELLTGSLPFTGEIAALAHAILHAERPSARSLNSALPAAVDRVLQKALAKNPAGRYATCTEFIAELSGALRGSAAGVAAPPPPRRRLRLAIAAALAFVALAGGAVWLYRPKAAPPPVPVPAAPRGEALYKKGLAERMAGEKERALVSFREAAEMGYPPAMVEIGDAEMENNNNESQVWFRKAAELGDATAMVYLGALYDLGLYTPVDYQQALEWYRKAIDKGNVAALFNLGEMYEKGHGVGQSIAQALEYYRQAAEKGNEEARARLEKLNAK